MRIMRIIGLTAILLVFAGTVFAADFQRVRVETTAGTFVVQLDEIRAPLSVANFLRYVEADFYTGTIFHRVVGGFIIQAGGFTTDLALKETEPAIPNESGNGLTNRRMTIAMARTGEPHSADSQFYINLADNTALDPKPTRWGYAVFGEVISGQDVIEDIGYRSTRAQGSFQNLPAETVVIEQITLEE